MQHDTLAMQYAVLTADNASFARAAAIMGIKQTTLSKRVTSLEKNLKLKLFDRTTRGAIPTPAGIPLLDKMRHALSELDNVYAGGHAMGSGEAGALDVGFSMSLTGGSLRALLTEFIERSPEVNIVGLERNRMRLFQALRTSEIDFAIVAGQIAESGFERRPLWSERVMVAVPEGHPLATKERIYWPDLRQERFIISRTDPGEDLARLANARLNEPGLEPAIETHPVSRDNMLSMVSLGHFLSFATESVLGREFPRVALREIHELSGSVATIPYAGFWRSDNASPILKRFLKLVGDRYPG